METRRYFKKVLGFILLVSFLIGLSTCKKSSDSNNTDVIDTGPIPKTTKIIESATWQNNIVALDTSNFTFTFKKDLLNTVKLDTGNILVSGDGPGYLRKITRIETQGDNIKVYTAFASLNEAVRDGSFNIQSVLSQKKIQKIVYYRSGIAIDTSKIKSEAETSIDATIDEYLDPDKKIHLTGSFSIGPSFNCDLVIKMFKVEQFRMEYEISEQINLDCTMELLNVQLSKEVSLVKITFTPLSFFIGPVPVIVTPELELSVGANLNVEAKVTTSVDQQMSYRIGVQYENNSWTPFQEKTNSFTFQPPTLTAKAAAKAYIKPQLNIKFYGTLAPYVYGEAYARIAADLLTIPWWTLYGGANVGAGVKMDIFGKELFDWPETPFYLFEYEKEITNSTNFQNNQPPTLPSNPQPLNNQTDVPMPVTVGWQCTDPENDPLTFDIYFGTVTPPPLVQSSSSSFTYNPGTLLENTFYYWKIIAHDDHSNTTAGVVWNFKTKSSVLNQPPLPPSSPNPPNGGLAVPLPVTLTWSCSDPENDPLTFDVFFGTTLNPPISSTNQNSTSFSPTGLVAGTLYYWKIIAKDDHGNATTGTVWSFTTAGITKPTVTTSPINVFTQTTATGGGNVTSDGGASVTARGVCWSITANPTITNTHTSDGIGTGSFVSNLTGLFSGTTYHVRAYATNSSGTSYGSDIQFTTANTNPVPPTVTTNTITNFTETTATGGGNVTSQGSSTVTARGVCWNTTGSPTTSDPITTDGAGTGNFTSNITGLTANTLYYVRAYATNSSGTAYGSQISFTTTGGTAQHCPGIPTITVNHVAGSVAPVNKTVTYGTVTNIPGEPSKCWITSNLGADHQATAVDDATEASAGWYWQFNRKQGYKNDGTSVTPTWTISYINENFDWQTSNDPCNLELGTGWRIPSYTEWNNVYIIGGWNDWTSPWNSGLKMHAAGYLDNGAGSLYNRGNGGYYFSSTEHDLENGWALYFDSNSLSENYGGKPIGTPLRCIKD